MGRGTVGLRTVLTAAVLLAGAACAGTSEVPGAAARSTTVPGVRDESSTAPDGTVPSGLDALLVAVADPGLAPYRRDEFGDGWDYDPTSGCNTRERVLIEESQVPVEMGERCKILSGRWRSPYDGVVTSDPADLQIDHFVPLADAWRSGADAWSRSRREAFANDLDMAATLVAVTGRTNQSKGDQTPDEWLPPEASAWCGYARDWVAVKARWELSVTPGERDALADILAGC